MAWYNRKRKAQPAQNTQPEPVAESAKVIQSDDEKSVRIMRNGYRYGFGESSLSQLLSGYGAPPYPDPRSLLNDSRAIVAFIPELACGIDIHKQVMGVVDSIECDDKRFIQAFQDWARELKWCRETTFEFDTTRGLASFTEALALEAMIDGMAFVRAIDKQGLDALTPRQQIDRLRLHDSDRFEFAEINTDVYSLYYEHGGVQIQDVRESEALKALCFNRLPAFPWGAQVTYNSMKSAQVVIESQANQTNATGLVSKAPMVTLISAKPEPALLESDSGLWEKEKKIVQDQLNTMLTRLIDGFKTSMAKGTRHHEFATATSELDVSTVSLAEGVQMNPKYSEDTRRMLSSVVLGAHVQPDIVNLMETGGGLGDGKWETTARVMMGYGQGLRPHVWQIIRHFFELHCTKNSILIPREYAPVWIGLILTENSARLKADETRAKIAELHAKNMQVIYTEFGATAANAYATEYQLTYVAP